MNIDLGSHLNVQTCGALWFTSTSLSSRPFPFNELDYFLDGLLTSIILESSEGSERKHFLTTTHFGRPFFLAQFEVGNLSGSLKNDLNEVHRLALKLRQDRGNIVVIGEHMDRIRSELKIFDKDFDLDFVSL